MLQVRNLGWLGAAHTFTTIPTNDDEPYLCGHPHVIHNQQLGVVFEVTTPCCLSTGLCTDGWCLWITKDSEAPPYRLPDPRATVPAQGPSKGERTGVVKSKPIRESHTFQHPVSRITFLE